MPQTIEDLVADLTPVRRLAPAQAWTLAGALTVLAVLAVYTLYGLRSDIMAGQPAGIVVLRAGALLLLGGAALTAVIASARPGVGHASHGWRWALGGALIFPLTSLVIVLADRRMPMDELTSANGPWCLGISGISALAIGTALTLWLRRGAPVALNRAGWLVGLAAGSFGTFAYSLHCPSATIPYVGIWYTLAVGLCALAGRLIAPRFLRW
jgi:hypothetical protein